MTRFLSRLLAVIAGALLVLLAPTAAFAHDTIVSSDPADGSSVETSPEQITLTYSAELLDITPVVRIVDAAGETVLETTPAIDGREAVATLDEPLPAGDYTVQWRVVSSDGHPIEGDVAFTVVNDPAPAEAAPAAPSDGGSAESASAQAAPTESATASPAATETEQEESGSSMMPLLLGIGVIAVAGALIATLVARRRGAARTDSRS